MEGESHFVALLKKQGRAGNGSRPAFGNDKEAAERGGRVSCWRAHGLEEWFVCPCERPALFSAGRCLCGKGSALSADRTFAWHRKEKPLRAVPGAGGVSEKRRIRFVFGTIPKGDDRVMRYLKGETLSFSEEECQGKKGLGACVPG